tara:strand:+ start:1927 stop:2439 length:513 start_codon:yes stop_codon:yes gene_type:complete
MKNIQIILICSLLSSCDFSGLSSNEKRILEDEWSGYTMRDGEYFELKYGKLGKFHFVTQDSKTDVEERHDFRGIYILAEKAEIMHGNSFDCVNPQKNIETITELYDLVKSDSTSLSSISCWSDTAKLTINRRQKDYNSFIWWKHMTFVKDSNDQWVKNEESEINSDEIFK